MIFARALLLELIAAGLMRAGMGAYPSNRALYPRACIIARALSREAWS